MNNKSFRVAAIILLFVHLSLMGDRLHGFEYDLKCFSDWAKHIYKIGLPYTYADIFNNYMPGYQYVLWVYSKMAGSAEAIGQYVYYLKSFTLAFDFLGLWYVYRWMDKKVDYLLLLFINIHNIAFSYNTMHWGQVDGIFSAMVFVSIYYAYQRRLVLGGIWYILAINMKLQAIIFAPVLGLIYLYWLADEKANIKKVFTAVGAMLLLQLAILLPFMTNSTGLPLLWNKVIIGSFSQFPYIGSYNFWAFVSPHNPWLVTDQTIFIAGISYKKAGLILFYTSSLLAMFPLMRAIYLKMRRRPAALPGKEAIWIICSLIGLLFYFFNTEMHERYSHPAWLFIIAYAFYTRRYFPYVVFSAAYFLVLENTIRWFNLNSYRTLVFNPIFIGSLFAVVIIYMFYRLYSLSAGKNRAQGAPAAAIS